MILMEAGNFTDTCSKIEQNAESMNFAKIT